MNQIVTMILRTILRKVMTVGINKSVDLAAGERPAPQDMTPEERRQANDARQAANRARKMVSLMRRIGR